MLLPRLKNGPCQYQVGARTITNRFIEDKLCFSASVSLMINQYDNGKNILKGFATFWEFSFYGQKKVADYEYHSLFAEKIHFHT